MSFSLHGENAAMGVKARVHYSRLLKAHEYEALLACTSVGEITDILQQTEAYESPLRGIPPSQVHRVDLETAVRQSILREAEVFMHYLNGAREKFFVDWLSWYEAENLKSIFRWILSGRLDRHEMDKRLFNIPGSAISYERLLDCQTYGDVLYALRGTKYYESIKAPVRRLEQGEKSLFALELAIDNLCEQNLFNDFEELPSSEAKLLMTYYGARVDLLNLYNFHRCMRYYNLSLEETLSRMLPVKRFIQVKHLREMSRAGTDWRDRLKPIEDIFPKYTKVFMDSLGEDDNELMLEMSIKRFLHDRAVKIFSSGRPGFHTVMGYFSIKSYEIDDIIRIIEDVRYGYEARIAKRYMIRPLIGGGEPKWQ